MNVHDLEESNLVLEQVGGDITLTVDGEGVKPRVVYLSTLWRTDCILPLEGEVYPALNRLRTQQFLQDIRFALSAKRWVPGKIENIEAAESKPNLFRQASLCGFTVPGFTQNAFSPVGVAREKEFVYKKQLGFPFTISTNTESGVEVGVTVTNTTCGTTDYKSDHTPWQWQETIEAIAQVRCCVVGNRVWSAVWYRGENQQAVDFRLLNQVQQEDLHWDPHTLPVFLKNRILSLNQKLGLECCAPEFLVTKSGEYVLIDWNPCGDWYGFFTEDEHLQIAEALAELLSA